MSPVLAKIIKRGPCAEPLRVYVQVPELLLIWNAILAMYQRIAAESAEAAALVEPSVIAILGKLDRLHERDTVA